MQNLNIPEQAIRNKMRQEGMLDVDVDNFFQGIYSAGPAPAAAAAAAPPLSMMDAIKANQGKMNHVEAPLLGTERKETGMLADIKAGMKLKHVDDCDGMNKLKPKSVVPGMMGDLMEIMARNRHAIMAEGSDGSDSDSDNDF